MCPKTVVFFFSTAHSLERFQMLSLLLLTIRYVLGNYWTCETMVLMQTPLVHKSFNLANPRGISGMCPLTIKISEREGLSSEGDHVKKLEMSSAVEGKVTCLTLGIWYLGGLGARFPCVAVSGFFWDQSWHWRPSHFPSGYYGTHRTDLTYLLYR